MPKKFNTKKNAKEKFIQINVQNKQNKQKKIKLKKKEELLT